MCIQNNIRLYLIYYLASYSFEVVVSSHPTRQQTEVLVTFPHQKIAPRAVDHHFYPVFHSYWYPKAHSTRSKAKQTCVFVCKRPLQFVEKVKRRHNVRLYQNKM